MKSLFLKFEKKKYIIGLLSIFLTIVCVCFFNYKSIQLFFVDYSYNNNESDNPKIENIISELDMRITNNLYFSDNLESHAVFVKKIELLSRLDKSPDQFFDIWRYKTNKYCASAISDKEYDFYIKKIMKNPKEEKRIKDEIQQIQALCRHDYLAQNWSEVNRTLDSILQWNKIKKITDKKESKN